MQEAGVESWILSPSPCCSTHDPSHVLSREESVQHCVLLPSFLWLLCAVLGARASVMLRVHQDVLISVECGERTFRRRCRQCGASRIGCKPIDHTALCTASDFDSWQMSIELFFWHHRRILVTFGDSYRSCVALLGDGHRLRSMVLLIFSFFECLFFFYDKERERKNEREALHFYALFQLFFFYHVFMFFF